MIKFNAEAVSMIAIPRRAAEELLTAPEAAIKLYLYGLLRTEAEVEQLSLELGLSGDSYETAMEYLIGASLVERCPGGFKYAGLSEKPVVRDNEIYEDASFNQVMQGIFGSRELSYGNYKEIYSVMEAYDINKQIMPLMAEAAITTHSAKNRLPISYLRRIAGEWAADGINTIEKAEKMREQMSAGLANAKEILRLLGIRRRPSEEEKLLYRKWTRDWGYDFAAIRAALSATTKAQYPSYAYLDGILKSLREEGKTSAEAILTGFDAKSSADLDIKRLLKDIGAPNRTVAPAHRAFADKWRAAGFGIKEISLACKRSAAAGAGSFDAADRILAHWAGLELYSKKAIEAYDEAELQTAALAERMIEAAGIPARRATGADKALVRRFTDMGMSEDMILLAAGEVREYEKPLKGIEKIISNWKAAGVTTLEEAKRECERHKGARRGAQPRGMERSQTQEELSAGNEDIMEKLRRELELEEAELFGAGGDK